MDSYTKNRESYFSSPNIIIIKCAVGGHHMVYQQQQQQQQQQQGQMRSYPNDPQGQGQGMKGPGQARPQHSYQGQGHQQSYQQPDFDGHQSALNGNCEL